MAAPGCIDLQVNGCLGVNFSSPNLTEKDFARACERVLADGVAAFLPTLVTCPVAVYARNLPLMSSVMRSPEFEGRVLGIHLEGPFISPEAGYVGAHDPRHVIAPDAALLERFQSRAGGALRMLTLAAELPGAVEVARRAVQMGIVASIGHSRCGEADLRKLAEAGATCVTHLGNGVPSLLPRHPNSIWAALAEDGLMASIVADGHHLPPSVLKSIIRAKGVSRTVVVSDLCPFAGLPPGEYPWCGRTIAVEETGYVHDAHRENLAGSGVGMAKAMDYLASLGFLSESDLPRLAYHNPLRLLGIDPGDLPGAPFPGGRTD